VCIPSWGISVSKPLLKSGVLSQWVVCCSSGEGGAPWSIPPRQRPTSSATVRSRSTNHTQHCAGPDTHNGSTRSGVPTGKKEKNNFLNIRFVNERQIVLELKLKKFNTNERWAALEWWVVLKNWARAYQGASANSQGAHKTVYNYLNVHPYIYMNNLTIYLAILLIYV